MDATETTIAFNKTIFCEKFGWNWNPAIWCKQIAGDHHQFVSGTKYPLDAWHIAKTLMLVAFMFAMTLYEKKVNWYVDFSIFGLEWLAVFNLFFNKIWISKKYKEFEKVMKKGYTI